MEMTARTQQQLTEVARELHTANADISKSVYVCSIVWAGETCRARASTHSISLKPLANCIGGAIDSLKKSTADMKLQLDTQQQLNQVSTCNIRGYPDGHSRMVLGGGCLATQWPVYLVVTH